MDFHEFFSPGLPLYPRLFNVKTRCSFNETILDDRTLAWRDILSFTNVY